MATVQFDDKDDDEPIKGRFCTCLVGARIIGCCAHVTALIWHLGICRDETIPTDDQLSASNFLSSVEDCIQHSDVMMAVPARIKVKATTTKTLHLSLYYGRFHC
ncbi:unnamed protein product [Rotaria sp. Silwood2]|nr:unnamed protein product [Rotaria sp. Silwood2]CAF4569266.1 unnamed protein product [Rotaria sp. Silwood2]CAF4638435.1 unnamed protein product [Rotaria sp. Silwood2]